MDWIGQIGRVGGSASESKSLVRLYRAVSKAELEDFSQSGVLRQGPNSLEGKWFAESAEDAQLWAQQLGGDNSVIAVDFSRDVADSFLRMDRLDVVGPARYADAERLASMVGWEVVP